MEAANSGHESIAMLLLACPEIQVNSVESKRRTALMFAALHGYDGVVKLLLAHPEVQINLVNDEGFSALMLAILNGHEGVVKLLLARNEIQVNLVEDRGLSALMLAARRGHESIVRLLLDVPHINTATKSVGDGHTAMSLALGNRHRAIAQLLQEFELRQTRSYSNPEDVLVGTVVDLSPLSSEKTVDEDVRSGHESDDSGSYHDAEEWLEEDGIASL
ncbi:ankyrin repeat-containing domain protein [Coprinopsis sp. MPI-PUGE-AT-0042]|nr:ankyrin repeat-containing domain protein [Coprinopsis sp. MPI-PUGE-AT-0042]